VDKIGGTAVNLTSSQTITGQKTFDTDVYVGNGDLNVGDSTLWANGDGVVFGTRSGTSPWFDGLVQIHREYNTIGGVQGLAVEIDNQNSSSGNMYAAMFRAYNHNSTSGSRHGLSITSGKVTNTGGISYGIRSDAKGGSSTYGIAAFAYGASGTNLAGYFYGDVDITGALSKGGGSFKIDHPLDPENKYLLHSFVESPDMMNIYNGNVTTDKDGRATVELPDYFDALNMDFRYQLTCIGTFAQAIVSDKVKGNSFTIETDKPYVEVSWQITGIRKDKWAEANRIQVEVEKIEEDKGMYLYPDAYGLGMEKSEAYKHIRQSPDHEENTPSR